MELEKVITPDREWASLDDLKELWHYRELLYFLAWRDLKVRYKQTVLGFAWAVMQPAFLTIVFTLFYGRVTKTSPSSFPYPLFVLCGMVPWQLFSYALSQSSNSLVANERLLTKVYFPRVIIPLSTIIAGLADFGVSFLALIVVFIYYGVSPAWTAVYIPAFVALAVITALAVGLWLAALNVKYRDIRHTLTFLTQIWLLSTPVAYPSSFVPEHWRLLYALNPMVGVVEGFRWALLGEPLQGEMILVSLVVVVLLFIGGLLYFRRMEDHFADLA